MYPATPIITALSELKSMGVANKILDLLEKSKRVEKPEVVPE